MASHKDRVLALCQQVASEYPDWQFVNRKFVNKVTKDAHFVINPSFIFRSTYMWFNISTEVSVLSIQKMVNKIAKKHAPKGLKASEIIYQQLNAVNLHTLTDGRCVFFKGDDAITDEVLLAEIHRWIAVGGDYLRNTWPIEDYSALFEVMKDKDFCYRGAWGIGFFCLAATLEKALIMV